MYPLIDIRGVFQHEFTGLAQPFFDNYQILLSTSGYA